MRIGACQLVGRAERAELDLPVAHPDGRRSSGRGGGPAATLPSRWKVPPWQGHMNISAPGDQVTGQPVCVQYIEKATKLPSPRAAARRS
jgi:hypothetical protein